MALEFNQVIPLVFERGAGTIDALRRSGMVLAVFVLLSAFVFASAAAVEQDSPTDYCRLLTDKANAAFGTTCGDEKYDYVGDVNSDRFVNINDLSSIASMDADSCRAHYLEASNPCDATGLPDIAAQSLSFSPEQPKAGEEVKFTAVFINKGTAATKDLDVGNSVDCVSGGSTSGSVPASTVVKPGETYTYTFSHVFSKAEACNVSASATTTGDSDTSNNKASVSLGIAEGSTNDLPDVEVAYIGMFPGAYPFLVGNEIIASVTIKNIGSATVECGKLHSCSSDANKAFYFPVTFAATGAPEMSYSSGKGWNDGGVAKLTVTTPPLKPGESREFNDIRLKYSQPGAYMFSASAGFTPGPAGSLTNEPENKLSNNGQSKEFKVHPKPITDEKVTIKRGDHFMTVGVNSGSTTLYTLLRYDGASRSTESSPVISFKNVITGEPLSLAYRTGYPGAVLALGGFKFGVYNDSDDRMAGFNIRVDLNGDGKLESPAAKQPNCKDSDGGKDYYKFGILKYNLNFEEKYQYQLSDSCSGSALNEYYCDANGNAQTDYFTCPHGCSEGACLKKSEPPKAGGFRKASWQCHDGSGDTQSSDTCSTSEGWKTIAEVYCRGRCSPNGKCGVNSFSVLDECSGASNSAPLIVSAEVPSRAKVGKPSAFAWRAEDADGDMLAWSVDWGDGTVEAQACTEEAKPVSAATASSKSSWAYKAVHTFPKPGQYTIKVSVDECGSGKSGGAATAHYLVSASAVDVAKGSCTDSDGGQNPNVKGKVKGYWNSASDLALVEDRCIILGSDDKHSANQGVEGKEGMAGVAEYFCVTESASDISPRIIRSVDYPCPNGCSNGACLAAAPKPVPIDSQGFDASVTLEKGWNLVGYSMLDDSRIRENTCSNKDILAAYGYDSAARKYFSLLDDEFSSLDRVSGVWLKLAGRCSVAYSLPEPYGWVEGRKLAKGWNLLSVVPDMVGSSFDDFSGSCKVVRAFGWNPAVRRWENIAGTELSSSAVGNGFVVHVAADCVLGVADAAPPQLPSETEETGEVVE